MTKETQTKPTNTTILLTRAHDLTAFASTDPARVVLNGVHYHAAKKRVEAANGPVCAYLPVTETPAEGRPAPTDCIIPSAALAKAMSNTSKKKWSAENKVRLDCNGAITLTTTDGNTEQVVTCDPIEGEYPDIDKCMPDGEVTLRVVLSARYLQALAAYALKHGCEGGKIFFEFRDGLSPIGFRILTAAGELAGLFAPMRPR